MSEPTKNIIKSVAVGIGLSMLLSVLTIFIFAWILFATSVSESNSGIVVLVITLVSTFAGGFIAARLAGSRGLMVGAVTGLLYFIVLYIFSCFIGARTDFSLPAISTVVFGILTAALGGIIAVNTKRK